jgi:hypothetical protein
LTSTSRDHDQFCGWLDAGRDSDRHRFRRLIPEIPADFINRVTL